MIFFCEGCKEEFSKSTKYHRCSKCDCKLCYKCPKCGKTYGANYQIHLKKCKKIVEEEGFEFCINSYKFGKEKIIAVTNQGEITVAYFSQYTKKFYFGKERAKR